MKILIEAHHPAHIHFWKYPMRELQARGHEVLMIGRDRDVMRRLLEVYDWIPSDIPKRRTKNNRFPVMEMVKRQWAVARAIRRFEPDVVSSLMGSYTQSAKLLGVRNIIFTDTETQAFNHKIAHPFADEIHTPSCFLKDLGRKHIRYDGLHELSFLSPGKFVPDVERLGRYGIYELKQHVVIRMSAWNTFHDRDRCGIGDGVYKFVENAKQSYKIFLSAEEGKVPPGLEEYACVFAPEDFHQLLACSRFVLTEGASTASEAACLGVPSVFINSVGELGNFKLLGEKFPLVQVFSGPEEGIPAAISRLREFSYKSDTLFTAAYERFLMTQTDVCDYVVDVLLDENKEI